MAIHCDDLDLLYLCTEKTGSTSVSNALLDQLGGRWVPREHLWDGDELVVDHKHSSLADLVEHGLFTEDEIRSTNVAITVRNPFAWVVSGYRYRRKVLAERERLGELAPDWVKARTWDLDRAAADFDDYVIGECELRDGSLVERYLAGFRDHPSLTYLRIETVDTDVNELLGGLGVGWRLDVPHDNTTSGVGYRSVYSDASRAMVEEHFARDLEMFGYEF